MKAKALLNLVLLFFLTSVSSQTNIFDIYSIEEGLPQTQVTGVVEDDLGRLWVGTLAGGLSIFDGKTFTPVLPGKTTLSRVDWIIRNNQGDILVLANSGTRCFLFSNAKTKSFIEIEYPDNYISYGLSENESFYLLDTKKGVYTIINNQLKRIYQSDKIALVKSPKGNVHIITDSLLLSVNEQETVEIIKDRNYSKIPFFRSLTLGARGELWYMGVTDGVGYYYNGEMTNFTIESSTSKIRVRDFELTADGTLWMATEGGGLGKLKDGLVSYFAHDHEFNHNLNNGLFIDSQNRIWLLGDGSGLKLFKGEIMTSYSKEDGMCLGETWSITEDDKGNVYIGTFGGGLQRIDENGVQCVNNEFGLKEDDVIRSLQYAKCTESLIIGTDNNIYEYKNGTLIDFKKKYNYKGGRVNSLGSNEEFVLFGSSQGDLGLYKYDGNSVEYLFSNEELKTRQIGTILMKNGRILIGGSSVLYELINGELVVPKGYDQANTGFILDLELDDKGAIFIGSSNVLFVLDDGQLVTLSKKNGLTSSVSFFLLIDKKNQLWMGNEKGVDIINLDEDYNVTSVKALKGSDGLKGSETNQGAVLEDSEGNIWIGTIGGVSKYNPEQESLNPVPPSLFINNLRLAYENVDWSKYQFEADVLDIPINPILDYDKNHLTFDFSAINLSNPVGVEFQYQLEGEDFTWLPVTKNSSITYSNLLPGDYSLKAKACNEDGIWTDDLIYSFTIEPPFWQTLWFKVGIVFFLGSMSITYIKWRESKLKKEKELLQKKVEERTSEINLQKELLIGQNTEIEYKNNLITDSINYAKKIQNSILPPNILFKNTFADHFILFRPKDIVSGDFYWSKIIGDWTIVACVDCTGHGVPGAFMSIISQNILEAASSNVPEDDCSPAKILMESKVQMQKMKDKHPDESMLKDGMAVSMLAVNNKTKQGRFSGSYHGIYVVRDSNIIEYKGDRIPIGHDQMSRVDRQFFQEIEVDFQEGDQVYMFTDGFADQKGGLKNKKYFYHPFRQLLLSIEDKNMKDQSKFLWEEFNNWKGDYEQYDDVLLIGLKI